MGRRANKQPCAREGCRAWAVQGEAYCVAHRPGNRPGGTAASEALGIYAAALTDEERRLFDGSAGTTDLEPEIWLLRVMSRRLFLALGKEDVDLETLRKLATVLYQGIARLAQLLRTRRALSGEAVDGLAGALAQALDELDSLNGGNGA